MYTVKRSRTLNTHHSFHLPSSESPVEEPPIGNNIEVCVRMRPLLESFEDEVVWEIDENNKTIKAKIEHIDLKSLNLSHPKYYADLSTHQKFTFDNVVGPDSKTKDLYNKLFKKIADSVVQGYNGTIFMYGQTTSGKTYTMLGTQKDPGVLPHSLRTVFLEMAKMKDYTFSVSVSYLEIYNEVINDLLVPGSTGLKVVDDPNYGVSVKGLKRQEVTTFEDAIYLMSFGEEHRKYRETNVNEQSSRSHTIYQVYIESYQTEDEVKKKRISCLNLVDLAGSERLADNGGTDGLQVGETGHINKSLFCLTNVIKKLADGRTSHIPYRDSKLTRILSNAVGGNSLTAVVCAISPALVNYAQTLSTLRFASRAKRVKNDATENMIIDVADQKLKEEVKYLREQLSRSENQINKVNGINLKLEDNLQVTKNEIKALQKEMFELKNLIIRESPRHQVGDHDLSNTSLFDIMTDGIPLTKSKSGKKTNPFANAHTLSQSNEMFFGDQIISAYEQIIADSTAVNTAASIENGCPEGGNNTKEWSADCLKAKQAYLKDLQELQKTYAMTLDSISQKHANKGGNFQGQSQLVEVETQVKTYLETEFNKIDSIQSKINDAIKAMSPKSSQKEPLIQRSTSTSSIKSFAKDQPLQNSDTGDDNALSQRSEHMRQYYDEVLSKMEKKYDEIYSLVTQNLSKTRDNIATDHSVMLQKRSSYINVQNVLQQHHDRQNEDKNEDEQRNNTDHSVEHVSLPRRLSTVSRSRSMNVGIRARESPFRTRLDTEALGRSYSSITDVIGQGAVYLWGSGKDGRLGNGRYANESNPVRIRDLRFAKVVCGYHNTFGVSQDGLLYGWGRNENGQLGVGTTMNAPIPLNITPLNKITIVDLAVGWQHCLALSVNGRLYSWGCGDEGQLGHGDNYELLAPAEIKFFEKTQVERIACGHSQSAAVTTEGALYTWGHNSDHRLMNANAKNYFIPALTELQKVRSVTLNQEETDVVSISMGATHMCVVTKSGKVYAAGRGNEGQLGKKLARGIKNTAIYQPEILNEEENDIVVANYFTEVETFGVYNKATMVACGEKFTLVLNEKNIIYSFGDASDGCLGIEYDETEKNIYEPRLVEKLVDQKITAIAAGARHAACISESGELYCWGFNYYDQVEVGEKEKNYSIPKKIEKLSKRSVSSVSCGYFHTAALVA